MPRVLGLLPAAGFATRLGYRSASKELEPIRSRPVIEFALTAMTMAGVEETIVVIRDAKKDLERYLVDRPAAAGHRVTVLPTPATRSIPATVDVARPQLEGASVLLAFPDVCFEPVDALAGLVRRHRRGSNEVTLALFASSRPDKTDMVRVTADRDRVLGFEVKPGRCDLAFTWLAAIWEPRFTTYLRSQVATQPALGTGSELHMSQVFAAALEAGLAIGTEVVADGRFVDIGTPEDLTLAREAW